MSKLFYPVPGKKARVKQTKNSSLAERHKIGAMKALPWVKQRKSPAGGLEKIYKPKLCAFVWNVGV
jgi:hypothetical protein